jgi:hypothetical protein
LTAIRTYTGTVADGSGGSIVRQFFIGYISDPTSGKSMVQYIQDCNAGACLPATTFDWIQRNPADNTQVGPGRGTWNGMPVVLGTGTLRGKVRTGDFNGDGRQDIVYSDGSGTWQTCLSTGTNFSCFSWAGPAITTDLQDDVCAPSTAAGCALYGDFNGDGKTDIAFPPVASNQDAPWTVCFATGASFNCQSVTFWSAGQSPTYYKVGDFDGDGRDDIISAAAGTEKLCQSTGASFTCGATAA